MRLPHSRAPQSGAAGNTADRRAREKHQMKKLVAKPFEEKCPTCNGTGYPTVEQPARTIRKIYPPPCKECGGKGRITEAVN
jgi:DnaJ-class molecular chaperone